MTAVVVKLSEVVKNFNAISNVTANRPKRISKWANPVSPLEARNILVPFVTLLLFVTNMPH